MVPTHHEILLSSRKHEILSSRTTWIKLWIIMWSEISQPPIIQISHELIHMRALIWELIDMTSIRLSIPGFAFYIKEIWVGSVAHRVKPPPVIPPSHGRIQIAAVPLPTQFPSNGSRKTAEMSQVPGYLPNMWETKMEFQAPSQLVPLCLFKKWTSR